jgi:hypothetical protein
VSSGSDAAAAKALLTPNGQRRRLNELTQSLQLLKVSSRRGVSLAGAASNAAAQPVGGVPSTGPAQHSGWPPGVDQDAAAPAPAHTAASRAARGRSSTPDADLSGPQEAAAATADNRASAEPAAAPKAGGRRGRRSTTPPAGASGVDAGLQQAEPSAATLRAELAATYDMLNAALAEKEALAAQLQAAQAAAEAERRARAAAEQEVQRLRGEAARALQESKVRRGTQPCLLRGRTNSTNSTATMPACSWLAGSPALKAATPPSLAPQDQAAATKAAQQRGKQLAQELAEAQQAAACAAAAAERGAELEARWGEAERALSGVLKAANAGLRAVAAGREEAKALVDARGEIAAGPHASGARQGRQSGGRLWR